MNLTSALRLIMLPGLLLAAGPLSAAKNGDSAPSAAQLEKFSEVYAVIKREYVDATDDAQLLNDALKGMVSGLDTHSSYLDYEDMKDNGVPNQGKFGGLGIEVAMENGLVRVVAPIEDTPAYQAGIRAGDVITTIPVSRSRSHRSICARKSRNAALPRCRPPWLMSCATSSLRQASIASLSPALNAA